MKEQCKADRRTVAFGDDDFCLGCRPEQMRTEYVPVEAHCVGKPLICCQGPDETNDEVEVFGDCAAHGADHTGSPCTNRRAMRGHNTPSANPDITSAAAISFQFCIGSPRIKADAVMPNMGTSRASGATEAAG